MYGLFRSCRKTKPLCFEKLKNHLLRLLIFSQRRFPFFVNVPVNLLQYMMACQGHSIDALGWSDYLFFVCYTTFKGNLCIPCSISLFLGMRVREKFATLSKRSTNSQICQFSGSRGIPCTEKEQKGRKQCKPSLPGANIL